MLHICLVCRIIEQIHGVIMPENSENKKATKFFHCHSCNVVVKSDDYFTRGDEAVTVCPVCDNSSNILETNWRVYNLQKAWENATGPKTEDGKARSSLNNYKHGKSAAQHHILAPAKPEKYPICESCQIIKECKSKPYKYCPVDLQVIATFVQAYKEQKINDLRELAGLTQANIYKVFVNMIHHIMTNGVMVHHKKLITDKNGNPVYDSDGNMLYNEWDEKNTLLKDLPNYVISLGFSAELQDMTPKTRQESESLKGFLDDKKADRDSLLEVKRRSLQEQTRMREAIEQLNAQAAFDKFNREKGSD